MQSFFQSLGVIFAALLVLGFLMWVWACASDAWQRVRNYRDARRLEAQVAQLEAEVARLQSLLAFQAGPDVER